MINYDINIPKISCLLVTANGRLEYFKKSVQCYLDQTYPNLELLIVNEGPIGYQKDIADFLKGLNRSDIKTLFLNGFYTLGALRNISIAMASGELFCQWDDDDFNLPNRLATQYSALSKEPEKKACFLSDQLHYYFETKEIFWEDWGKFLNGGFLKKKIIPGTVLAWKNNLPARYPSSGSQSQKGEDSVFSDILCEEKAVTTLSDCGNLQVYTYHGGNVWDIGHHQLLSRRRSHSRRYMIKNRKLINKTLDYLKFEGETRVMGEDGLAFTHKCK